jgi:hypothetical protein
MTPDGKWILGNATNPKDPSDPEYAPWLWSEETGLIDMLDLFRAQGLGPDFEGWIESWGPRVVSANGLAIGGTSINRKGYREGWVVYLDRIGLPWDYNGNSQLDAGDLDAMAVGMMSNDARFDLDRDGDADVQDRLVWINDKKRTWVGDSNLDGEFNTSDLVAVFTSGKYETADEAGWAFGDWNGDLRFSTSDMVFAFTQGGYERGPRAASPVPEPTTCLLIVLGGVACCAFRARR